MGYLRRFRGTILWAPVGAIVVIGALVAGTMFASAAAPNLPKKTPAQLLAAMAHAKLPPAMTAVISQNANLGFPALPGIAGLPSSALSAASWLAGSHTVQIWYSGPHHVRIAVPVSFGETDLRVNGSQVWLWQSQGQVATHLIVAKSRGVRAKGIPLPAICAAVPRWRMAPFRSVHPAGPVLQAVTPLQAAQRLLALVGPTTKVTITGTTVVAGRPAYQLSVEPRSEQSLIGQVLIAVDGTSYLPLQVQVVPRGSSSPAFQVGYTTFSPGQPAASNFTFTPPPGAHVHVVKLDGLMGLGGPMCLRHLRGVAAPRIAMVGPAGPRRVLGSGWLSVLEVSAGQALAGLSGGSRPVIVRPGAHGPAGSVAGGQVMAMLRPLLNSAARVHGDWGSGRLISTRLVNILITSKGQILIGAVTPAVLYADAAKAR